MRVVTFKADDSFIQQIEIYAQKVRMNRSQFIRRAIEEYIIKLETQANTNHNPNSRIIIIE